MKIRNIHDRKPIVYYYYSVDFSSISKTRITQNTGDIFNTYTLISSFCLENMIYDTREQQDHPFV